MSTERLQKIRKDLNLIEGAVIRVNGAQLLGEPASTVTGLTDNSGGSASGAVAAITAGASYSQADLVAVKNGLASIIAKQNAIINALTAQGLIA